MFLFCNYLLICINSFCYTWCLFYDNRWITPGYFLRDVTHHEVAIFEATPTAAATFSVNISEEDGGRYDTLSIDICITKLYTD